MTKTLDRTSTPLLKPLEFHRGGFTCQALEDSIAHEAESLAQNTHS